LPLPTTDISPLFKADTVNIAGSASKDDRGLERLDILTLVFL